MKPGAEDEASYERQQKYSLIKILSPSGFHKFSEALLATNARLFY